MEIKYLFQSIRPKTLMVGAAPVLLGSSYAKFIAQEKFSYLIFALTLICTIFLQSGTNIVNEYFDFKTGVDDDSRVGPLRSLQQGKLSPNHLKHFYRLCFISSVLFGFYLMYIGGLPIVIVGFVSIFIAYIYTGGPFPLSHYYLGELMAFIFFGPVAVLGTTFLQLRALDMNILQLSFIPGFISAALMSLNNLRDIETDKKTSKRTIAIKLGQKKARYFTLALALSPILIILNYSFSTEFIKLLFIIIPLIFTPLWKIIINTERVSDLNEGIALFGKYNLIHCIALSVIFFL